MPASNLSAARHLLTELGLTGLLEVIDDSTETARFLLAMDKQSALARKYILEGEPAKFPKIAWFRRTKDGTLRTVLMHGTRILFDGNSFIVNGGLTELLSAYRLIRNHAATGGWDDYLWLQSGSKRTTPSSVTTEPAPEPTLAIPEKKSPPPPMLRNPKDRDRPRPVVTEPLEDLSYPDEYYPGELDRVDQDFYNHGLHWLGHEVGFDDEPLVSRPLTPLLSGYHGSKLNLLQYLAYHIPRFSRFVEPFAGSGVLSLNLAQLDFDMSHPREYLMSDANPDITNLHHCAQNPSLRCDLMDYARTLFANSASSFEEQFAAVEKPTDKKELRKVRNAILGSIYNPIRAEYNKVRIPWTQVRTDDPRLAATFLFLHTNAFKSTLRYNKSGGVNSAPEDFTGFPESAFADFLSVCADFEFRHCETFRDLLTDDILDRGDVLSGDVVYCDPPYAADDGNEASKRQYGGKEFTRRDQEDLAELARHHSRRGATVIISNNDNDFTRNLYADADRLTVGLNVKSSLKTAGKGKAPKSKIDKPRRELIAVWLSPSRRKNTLIKGVLDLSDTSEESC